MRVSMEERYFRNKIGILIDIEQPPDAMMNERTTYQ